MPNERRMPNSGNLGGGNRSGGGPDAGTNKGNKSGSGGARSAKAGPPGGLNRGNPGKPGYDGKPGGSGGPKKKNGSIMRESTWNNISKGERMREHGTTSYAKYKASKKATNVGGTSRTNIQMRGKK